MWSIADLFTRTARINKWHAEIKSSIITCVIVYQNENFIYGIGKMWALVYFLRLRRKSGSGAFQLQSTLNNH